MAITSLGSEKADYGPWFADFGPERADSGSDKSLSNLRKDVHCTLYKRMYGRMVVWK